MRSLLLHNTALSKYLNADSRRFLFPRSAYCGNPLGSKRFQVGENEDWKGIHSVHRVDFRRASFLWEIPKTFIWTKKKTPELEVKLTCLAYVRHHGKEKLVG